MSVSYESTIITIVIKYKNFDPNVDVENYGLCPILKPKCQDNEKVDPVLEPLK